MFLRFGVHLARCGIATFSALFVYLSSYCQRAAGDVLRRIFGPSLETGAVFDTVLSVNYCAIAIRVSVMRVQEMCDEKGWKAGSGRGASAACRLPLWLRRGEGVSEKFRAAGEREHTTLSET